MKKRVITLFLALAMVVSLAACGGGGGVAGTYNLTSMNAGGISMDIDQITALVGSDVSIVLNLKSGGSFSLDMDAIDSSESLSGTWTAEDGTLTLTAEDGTSISGSIDGGTIVLEESGQTLTFEKG